MTTTLTAESDLLPSVENHTPTGEGQPKKLPLHGNPGKGYFQSIYIRIPLPQQARKMNARNLRRRQEQLIHKANKELERLLGEYGIAMKRIADFYDDTYAKDYGRIAQKDYIESSKKDILTELNNIWKSWLNFHRADFKVKECVPLFVQAVVEKEGAALEETLKQSTNLFFQSEDAVVLSGGEYIAKQMEVASPHSGQESEAAPVSGRATSTDEGDE